MPDERLTPRIFGEPYELLALDETAIERTFTPTAFSLLELLGIDPPQTDTEDDVAVVHVEGPLDTRGSWCWDGYDTVEERVREALAQSDVRAVVLALDSPGGMAAGMLDGARALRRAIEAAGKPCVAWAGTMACSAAYGLAAACDAIVVTEDGEVGSVGVLARVVDRTAQNEKQGLTVRVVRSGTLKADPHPDIALTDASVARVRARVMELAVMFGGYVAGRRPQCGDVLAHQGAAFMGATAVEKGFADAVGTLADAIAHARQLADAQQENENAMNVDKNSPAATATLAQLRAAVGATTDDELVATVTTLKVQAGQLAEVAKQRDEARAQLAARDQADKLAAREKVLARHRDRGALTKALEDDAAFMADLAPLSAEALDRVLSRLPGLPTTPLAPRKVAAVNPEGVAPKAVTELTPLQRKLARQAGLTDEEFLAQLERDEADARARHADDSDE